MVQDTELYRHLLGIVAPWTVERVELDARERRVDVWAGHPPAERWPCSPCGRSLSLFDHAEERVGRHLDSCAFQTFLHARVPRVECPEHGKLQVRVPWAEPNSRFTALFERWSIQVMQQTDTATAAELLGIRWEEAGGIPERAVARGVAAKPPLELRAMGVDEKAVGRGPEYATLVYHLEKVTVEWVGEGRKKETLDRFFGSLSLEQRSVIEAVGLDMGEPFIASILEHVPSAEAKRVFDRFPIAKHANEAVDRVRKSEDRELWASGDPAQKGSQYRWLYRGENLPEKHRDRFAALPALHRKTGRAYAREGGPGGALGVREPGVGEEVLGAMVLVGAPLAAGADDRGGSDGERPPVGGVELHHAPDHERGGGGAELEDRDPPEDGLRVPEQGALPNGRAVPMWGPIALPEHPRQSRMNHFWEGGVYGIGWNGTDWLIGGNSTAGPSLLAWNGASTTLLTSAMVTHDVHGWLQLLAWNGAEWLVGGQGVFGTLRGPALTDLLSGYSFNGSGAFAGEWNGTAWLAGGGSGGTTIVRDDRAFPGPELPADPGSGTRLDQAVLLILHSAGGWLIGGKGTLPSGSIAPALYYWNSTVPSASGFSGTILTAMVPGSFAGGEIQPGGAAPEFGAHDVLVVGEGAYDVRSGHAEGALALVSY